jgi:cytochrome P450
MEWIEECAKGRPYNPITAQLSISIAAIHTTSDLVTQVLYDLAGKQDLIQALREEVIAMLREDGWKKSTLFKLKLMDSVLKETQRMKPSDISKCSIEQSLDPLA